MNLVVILDSLSAGGIQASAVKLLERCKGAKSLILLEKKIEMSVPPDVTIVALEGMAGRGGSRILAWWRRIAELRRQLFAAQPDIVLSMGFSVNVMVILSLLLAPGKFKLVVGIRNSLKELALTRSRWNFLRLVTPWVYRYADLVITVSRGIADEFRAAGIADRKLKVIYNGYDFERVQRLAEQEVDHEWYTDKKLPLIISAGRLSVQKNFPLLLEAFRIVSEQTSCRLVLLGDGPEEGRLRSLAERLGIVGKVAFLGHQGNPYRFFAKSDVFALSSQWEGFPNVLCEAMACGLPVVSTDCPTGPNEIIRNGENGLLVPSNEAESLAMAMLKLLHDKELRCTMAKKARESVQAFTIEKMVSEYDACFERLLKAG